MDTAIEKLMNLSVQTSGSLTLLVLSITLLLEIVLALWTIKFADRKKLYFFNFKHYITTGTSWVHTNFELKVTNNSRRKIVLHDIESVLYDGTKETKAYFHGESRELEEHDDMAISFTFEGRVNSASLYKITVLDTTGQQYQVYVKNGKFTYKWIARYFWLEYRLAQFWIFLWKKLGDSIK